MQTAWFSNPRHLDSNPTVDRKRNLETSMTTNTLFGTNETTSFQNGDPESNRNKDNSKPGPQSVLPCAPRCRRIVPGSLKMPKWEHKACQMSGLGTRTAISVPKVPRIPSLKARSTGLLYIHVFRNVQMSLLSLGTFDFVLNFLRSLF